MAAESLWDIVELGPVDGPLAEGEGGEGGGEGEGGEGGEGGDGETTEAEQQENQQLLENVESIQEDASKFKELLGRAGSVAKTLMGWAVKTSAAAVIFYGMAYALKEATKKKSTSSKARDTYKKKKDIIMAVNHLITMQTSKSKDLAAWMIKNKDVYIKLGGLDVPVTAEFKKVLDPMKKAVEDAYTAASALKIVVDGKTSYKVPTEGDLTKLLVVCDEFHQAFVKLQKFVAEHVAKQPVLKTVPLTKKDIESMKTELEKIQSLPIV